MTVGIIGSGTMGSGIAQIAASHDCQVKLFDNNPQALTKASSKLEKILNRLIEKEKIDENQKSVILNNIDFVKSIYDLEACDLVIEAIIENPEIKKSVFKELEQIVSKDCIIASNTSSLSITSLASSLDSAERFIGIHFFNPAPLMKLVEIIPALQTSEATINKVFETIDSWNKTTVQAKDTPGFIVNKVARPFYSEALRIYEEGIADIDTIDWAMKEIAGFRMGPFELMDYIGHDVNYTVTETVFREFYFDPRYKPSFSQKRLVEAGYLGRKSERGFYNYNPEQEKNPTKDKELGIHIAQRVIVMIINEAADTLQFGIASKEDIDLAMTKGVNYPKAPFKWADDIGIAEVIAHLDQLYDLYKEDRYRCSALLRFMSGNNLKFYPEEN